MAVVIPFVDVFEILIFAICFGTFRRILEIGIFVILIFSVKKNLYYVEIKSKL